MRVSVHCTVHTTLKERKEKERWRRRERGTCRRQICSTKDREQGISLIGLSLREHVS